MVVGKTRRILPEDLPIFRRQPPPETPADSLDDVEKAHIRKILAGSGWNIAHSAKTLGIDRSTLYNKIKRYGIQKTA